MVGVGAIDSELPLTLGPQTHRPRPLVQERTYIVGPFGGKGGTIKVDTWTNHLPEILDHPDADVPIPYTELLITELPGYLKCVFVCVSVGGIGGELRGRLGGD